MKSYNYYEILLGILDGKITNINFVQSIRCSDRTNDTIEGKLIFAGTTEEDLDEVMQSAITACKPNKGEKYVFIAIKHVVQPCDITEEIFDSECNDEESAEDSINKLCQELFDDGWYEVVYERMVEFEYEKLEGSILVYWAWRTYVGYVREFELLEYCTDCKMTAKDCLHDDRTGGRQITCLISASELKDFKSASEIVEYLSQELDYMGLWKSFPNVEEAIRTMYADAERFPNLYELPINDLDDLAEENL